MVNEKNKAQILRMLREAGAAVSGEEISRRMGLSRVAVWKHIQKLQELGYHIDAAAKGYRLLNAPDAIYPWEFPGREDRIHYFPVIDSTMNEARRLARNGCPHFTVAAAGVQQSGRGRLNRFWASAEGGLFFTVILRPELPAALSHRVNFGASLELAKTLKELFGLHIGLKWPNDLRISGQKVAGILSEMETESELISHINLGVGLNVNNDIAGTLPEAVSISGVLGKPVSRKTVLSCFLDRFEKRMATLATENPIPEWKQYTDTLHRPVEIVTAKETVRGQAVDVDTQGALIVRRTDGAEVAVVYGDCFYQG